MVDEIIIEIQTRGYSYRGQIISDLIHLERLIDEALCRQFSSESDKRTELMEVIFGNERMSFDAKIQVFQFMFVKYQKEFLNKFPDMIKEIRAIQAERNIVAHYLLNTSDEGRERIQKDGNIGFVKFRNSTETLWRGQTEYNKFHGLTGKYIQALEEFLIQNP